MAQSRKLAIFFMVLLMAVAFVSAAGAQDGAGMININEATVEELCELNKIGPSYAERIVQYRQQNGPFEKPEDITKVKGIGPKTFEANKGRITVK